MRKMANILAQILLFIPRLVLRLVRGRQTSPMEEAPPPQETAEAEEE